MLTLAILGFLYDQPLHGYELKSRITGLTGHVRPVSDGALYPAITRLEKAGLLDRRTEPGTGAVPRQTLALTAAGRAELRRRLADPEQAEITDQIRFFALAAFLHHLADPARQAAVLRRRLDFLEAPSSFFYDGRGRPVTAEREPNPFRRGMLLVARASGAAERAWLAETIEQLTGAGPGGSAGSDSAGSGAAEPGAADSGA
ncbi:PadR family transcriptional regulator [Streptomyces sp. SP17BM10]|uniref:PadR family transcriptional regulator n=1 Tax=Streptomyces sp. SP17BM10 TaxID=3002530 RepID=UPI002E773C73|nr:PadR family transcriptional regulator [Streptomyces sp. SP17BM10]MEE1783682.1 PadR family transcriptional regulator [Streptomyces sp. SP17BM10]